MLWPIGVRLNTASQFERDRLMKLNGPGPAEVARAAIATLTTLPDMTERMIALDGSQCLKWPPHRQEAAEE